MFLRPSGLRYSDRAMQYYVAEPQSQPRSDYFPWSERARVIIVTLPPPSRKVRLTDCSQDLSSSLHFTVLLMKNCPVSSIEKYPVSIKVVPRRWWMLGIYVTLWLLIIIWRKECDNVWHGDEEDWRRMLWPGILWDFVLISPPSHILWDLATSQLQLTYSDILLS